MSTDDLRRRTDAPTNTTVRVLLYTGKGGVGKTTAAAGTATIGAARGLRTLVLSTDAAHSLADAFDAEVDGRPTEIDDHLFVQQVDAQHRFEASWGEIQDYLLDLLDAAGVDPIAAEELTVLPGAEEIFALLELRDQVKSGDWDLVVVDCAPTAETLRLLALPEALTWYMDRVFPTERRLIRAFKPVLTRATGMPMPHEPVFDAVERLHADLLEVREMLSGDNSSVRLVLTPEAVVVAEARRTMTTLSLYGYRVDGVVANRIFPAAGADAWRRRWVAAQSSILEEVGQSFAPMPIWHSPYRSCEPVGVAELAAFAVEVYGDDDPFEAPSARSPVRMERDARDDEVRLRWDLPFAARDQVDLARHGDELVVTVGSYRRVLAMPVALRRCEVVGAGLQDGALVVRFADPEPAASVPRGGTG